MEAIKFGCNIAPNYMLHVQNSFRGALPLHALKCFFQPIRKARMWRKTHFPGAPLRGSDGDKLPFSSKLRKLLAGRCVYEEAAKAAICALVKKFSLVLCKLRHIPCAQKRVGFGLGEEGRGGRGRIDLLTTPHSFQKQRRNPQQGWVGGGEGRSGKAKTDRWSE